MLIDELKKANIEAMKARDTDARAAFSIVLTKSQLLLTELRAKGQEISDANVLEIIQKTLKELSEHYDPKNITLNITGGEPLVRKDLFDIMDAKLSQMSLVDNGFRLPSALDNRPLTFEEFYRLINQVIFVSATPGEYERKNACMSDETSHRCRQPGDCNHIQELCTNL